MQVKVQHEGWGSTLHLLRLMFYLVLMSALLGLARLGAYVLQRSLAGRRHAQQPAFLGHHVDKQPVKPLPLLAFPRLELTVTLLCTPALAAAGASKAPV